MKTFRPAKRRIQVSVGESVRILRELQDYSQNELARLTGIPQGTLFAIENDRVGLGIERREASGAGLKVPPGRLGLSRLGRHQEFRSLTGRVNRA